MFFNHRAWELPVGKWDAFRKTAKVCLCVDNLPRHSGAADLKAAMEHGTVEGMSVGLPSIKTTMHYLRRRAHPKTFRSS
jgi:HK97 family phage prohead protease